MAKKNLDDVIRLAQEARGANEIERRAFSLDAMRVEKRADALPLIVGHAAVFNQEADIAGYFLERVAPGAFKRAIAEDDVRSLFNHDPNFVLGRNRAKPTPTLSLSEDETGLLTATTPPDTTVARDLLVTIGRGDVSQMSFAMRVTKEQWEEKNDDWLRTILEVRLYDISPVTFPAYPTTDVGLRSLDASRKQKMMNELAGGQEKLLRDLGQKKQELRLWIGELGLSTYVLNSLQRADLYEIGELVQWTERELMEVPYIGRKALVEIAEVLGKRGLKLGTKVDDMPRSHSLQS